VQPLSPCQQNLFDEHLNWAVQIARNIARKMPTAFDPEDLVQAGRIGLWKAVHKFNPKRGIPFQGFAYCYVRGEIMMRCRRRSWKEATTHDELTKQEVDPRPLQDEQLHSQADELMDERRLLLVRSLAALLPAAQCEAVRGILAGASRDELATAMGLSRQRLWLLLNAAATRLRNMRPQLSEPQPQRPRSSSPAFVPMHPPLRTVSMSEQPVPSEAEQGKKAFCTKSVHGLIR
jgi:RNA polymerase sigma factor (sigma-70 family)